jgi:hypothetical protein
MPNMAKKQAKPSKSIASPQSTVAQKPASLDNKKKIMMHGIGLHLVVYILISMLLYLFGVPAVMCLIVFMVLFWGLFVMSYAYYYHK